MRPRGAVVALPYEHVKLVQYGTIKGTQDWSTSLTLLIGGTWPAITAAGMATWLGTLDTAAKAWWTGANHVGSQNNSDVLYIGIKAYHYFAGHSAADVQADHPFTTAQAGTGTGTTPTQCSLVTSCLTGLTGRANRGRRYLPMTSGVLTDMLFAHSVVDALCAAEQTWIQAVNASTLVSGSISARVGSNQSVPPAITSIKIDTEPDVQRRRADKIVADYAKTLSI